VSLAPAFDPVLSRVRLSATVLTGATTALFERSKNGLLWTTVRGGSAVPVTGSAAAVDDYEFQPGVINYYRVTGTPGAVVFTADITPAQAGVWVKSITRPFLNRELKVVEHSDIVRPSRAGVFPVIGRTMPVGVTDVQLSRRWTMIIKGDTVEEADALDLVFASGDPMFIQTPATGLLSTVPGGYVLIGDVVRRRFGTQSPRRWFELPLTEVAAPGPGVYGVPATWETIVAEFGTWSTLVTQFSTWADVTSYISDPSVVIVP
jgi:hypothetical protein